MKKKPECDHIIGEWEGCYEGGSVALSDRRTYAGMIEVEYQFCPLCGKDVSAVHKTPNEPRISAPDNSPMGKMFQKEVERISPKILKSLATSSPFFDCLTGGENKSGTITVVIHERA